MLKSSIIFTSILSTTLARAETCALDFNTVENLHVHQRVALEHGRANGFTIRVFSQTIEGVVRTVALAGRAPRDSDRLGLAGHSMKAAFPEIGLTHESDKFGRRVQLPPRPLAIREAARIRELVAKNVQYLRGLMKTKKVSLEMIIDWVESETFQPIANTKKVTVTGDASEIKLAIVSSLRAGEVGYSTAAEQVVFDLEQKFTVPLSLRLHRMIFAEARRWAFVSHRAFSYLAGALIGTGAAIAWRVDPHAAWISAAGAAVLGARIGVIVALNRPPDGASELRARNTHVASETLSALSHDRDIDEMLILTEQNRVHGLGVALERAGFTEIKAANQP